MGQVHLMPFTVAANNWSLRSGSNRQNTDRSRGHDSASAITRTEEGRQEARTRGGEASKKKKMGNCVNKKKIFNPGAVLDRVIAGSGPEDECLLYKLANFKKGVK